MLVRLSSLATLRMIVDVDSCWLFVDGKSNGTPNTQIEMFYSDRKSAKH